jgi:hypothetical protein
MKRIGTATVLLATSLSGSLLLAQRVSTDTPEPVIRSLVMAIYANDIGAYEKLTVPHPLRARLTVGGRVNESALKELKDYPGGLQIKERRPLLYKGQAAMPGTDGNYPVGTTGFYMVSHHSPMVVKLVRAADGWKVDLRWWIAMTDIASGKAPGRGSPELAIRSMLHAMLRLDRGQAARYLTDPRNIDILFTDAPRQREPSGVLDAAVEEMPLVEVGPGEFYPMAMGPVVEGVTDPNRKVIVGLFGPIEMPFVVRRVSGEWRVEAQPYFDLMNQ